MSEQATRPSMSFIDLQAQHRRIADDVNKALARVFEHGQFIMGPEVSKLEERLAGFCGATHAVTCSSGTDALLLALMAADIGPGDAVFIPAMTFPATPEVVALLRGTPVFVDVDDVTMNLSVDSLASAIDDARERDLRPRAVIAVDLYGLPADYRGLAEVSTQHGLVLIADAAQSFGGEVDGGRVGTLAPVTATSFFPAKPLGCYGDGGALFTDDDGTAETLRSLRVHGQGDGKYDVRRIGINGRLDTLQAAVLLEKLRIFPDELTARGEVAKRYDAGLSDFVETPRVPSGVTSAWAQYTIKVDERDRVADLLREWGIPTAVYYPRPLHRQPAYEDFPRAPEGLHVSEDLAERVLSLPMHPYLTVEDQHRIIHAVVDAVS